MQMLHNDNMFRIILKIVLIALCSNSHAELESIESLPAEVAILAETIDTFDTDPLPTEAALPLNKDVVLVLDNSGSMKKNDPDFLVSKAVREFISQQDENTQVSIVIFDQDVQLPISLMAASIANRETILNSLDAINYKGLFTDSPAGIERAIYELKNNGRDTAQKSIIFMTDGIVDTGAVDRDLEKSRWLREDLAADAADNKIKIFGIAFTDGADFQLIQSIAQKTSGEYYRALVASDLRNVFEKIDTIINTPPESVPEVVATPPVVEVIPPPIVQPAPAPIIVEVPVQTMGPEERIRSIIMIAAAILLAVTLLGILILLWRRNKQDLKASGAAAEQEEAYINDLQGNTNKETHKLGTKPTMFGRVVGKDTDRLDYIVVNETTIGRRHALIEYKDYSYWIIDQGSINGTFVNGEAVRDEVRLKHGDRIRLHKCIFEFIMPELEDSGITTISNTVIAANSLTMEAAPDAVTEIRVHDDVGDTSDPDIDFNLTASDLVDELSDPSKPEPGNEETLIPTGNEETIISNTSDMDHNIAKPEFILDEDTDAVEPGDETIVLDPGDESNMPDDNDDFDISK